MKRINYFTVFLVVMTFLFISKSGAQESLKNTPKTLILDGSILEKNYQLILDKDPEKTSALKSLLNTADKLLKEGKLYSVMHKKQIPPSGNKHDYMSTGPYWWPDPSKPDGLPYIKKDGIRNPTYYDISDSQEIDRMKEDVETLALSYYFTKDFKYAQFASKLIQTWFLDEETRQNPNLNFGQGIPGKNSGRGIGIIETRELFRIIDAAIIIYNTPSWSVKEDNALKKWFSDYLGWLRDTPMGKDEADELNNHGTYYSVQVIDYAFFTGNIDIALSEIEVFKNRLENQLSADGSQPHELSRTKSWNYTNMNLYGYFLVARLAENNNERLWSHKISQGKSIQAALEWMMPFIKNEKIWNYEQIQKIKFEETIRILKTACIKYNNPEYESLAKNLDLKSYESEINQLTL